MSKIAIVILNWNGKKLLETFLPSVMAYSKEADIYIADNASTDDSVQYVQVNFPDVTIIQNKENGGYAKGYNDALRLIEADIFCLLNSDVEVTEGWLPPIMKVFQDKNVSIVQPKLLDYHKKDHFEYAGAAGGFIDKYGYAYCRGRIFDTIEKDEHQYDDSTIFWASGACFFIRADVFKALNGFDESFFAHFEEIDLCWRAFNQGYVSMYVSDSTVFHVGGATLNNSNPKKTYFNFRNSLYTIIKNAGGNLLLIIIIRMVLDGLAGFKFLLELKPLHLLAILKAHLSFYATLPSLLKHRKQLKQTDTYYNTKSIVWSYFIKQHKRFNSL
ncbi:MAG: glycosyltransferase family 2 protein [Aquaticitalea sp.]